MIADILLSKSQPGDHATLAHAAFGLAVNAQMAIPEGGLPQGSARVLPDFADLLAIPLEDASKPGAQEDGAPLQPDAEPLEIPAVVQATLEAATDGKDLPVGGKALPPRPELEATPAAKAESAAVHLPARSSAKLELAAKAAAEASVLPTRPLQPAQRPSVEAVSGVAKLVQITPDHGRLHETAEHLPGLRQPALTEPAKAQTLTAPGGPLQKPLDRESLSASSQTRTNIKPATQAASNLAPPLDLQLSSELQGKKGNLAPAGYLTANEAPSMQPQTHVAAPFEAPLQSAQRAPTGGLESLVRDPAQLETLIENLTLARETGRHVRGEMQLRHEDFGLLTVRLASGDGDIKASLTSRDPAFALAAQQALGERVVQQVSDSSSANARSSDQPSGHSGQSNQRGAETHTGAQAGADAQSGSQSGAARGDELAAQRGEASQDETAKGARNMPAGGLFA